MIVTPSKLRQNIYKLLDKVIKTGVPLEIKRKGKILRIIPPSDINKLENLKKRNILNCDPDDIISNNWENEWKA